VRFWKTFDNVFYHLYKFISWRTWEYPFHPCIRNDNKLYSNMTLSKKKAV